MTEDKEKEILNKKDNESLEDEDPMKFGEVFSAKDIMEGEGRIAVFMPFTAMAKADEYESQQLQVEQTWIEQQGLMTHPFSTGGLLTLKRNNIYFDACVKQIAKDVVGKGFKIELIEGASENKTEHKTLQDFLKSKNNKGESLRAVLNPFIRDLEWCGWCGLEIAKTATGEIANPSVRKHGLYHVPAQNLYVHSSREKYCQVSGARKVWFKDFDAKKDISAKTGDPIKTKRDFANSMIFYRNYFEETQYYGAPNIFSAIGEVKGSIGLRDFNLAFFENYAVPAGMLWLSGKWKKPAVKKIIDFLDVEIRGSSAAHKTLVFRLPEGTDAKWEKLSVDVKEGSFDALKKSLRDDILASYQMPPYRLNIAEVGSLGGNVAKETLGNYVENIVEPPQTDIEEIFNEKIVKEGLGIESYVLKFENIEIKDKMAEAELLERLFGMAVLTPNQIIDITGVGERFEPEGDQHYILQQYLPVGEEPTEKMRSDLVGFFQDFKRDIPKYIRKIIEKELTRNGYK